MTIPLGALNIIKKYLEKIAMEPKPRRIRQGGIGASREKRKSIDVQTLYVYIMYYNINIWVVGSSQ